MTKRCKGIYSIKDHFAHLNGHCGNGCNDDPITTDGVIYSGPNLPCTGINTCDDITIAFQKMDEIICGLVQSIYNLTSTTTTTTTII